MSEKTDEEIAAWLSEYGLGVGFTVDDVRKFSSVTRITIAVAMAEADMRATVARECEGLSVWWREAIEVFSANRIMGRTVERQTRTAAILGLPFNVRSLRAIAPGRDEAPAVLRSTDPGQP